MNEIIDSIQTSNITEDNKLVKCAALVITQLLGIKEVKSKKKEEPLWKRRTGSNVNALRKAVSLIERWETGMLRKSHEENINRITKKIKNSGLEYGRKM